MSGDWRLMEGLMKTRKRVAMRVLQAYVVFAIDSVFQNHVEVVFARRCYEMVKTCLIRSEEVEVKLRSKLLMFR